MGTTASPVVARTACLVCGSARSDQRFVQRGYPVFHCNGCGFEYVAPTPTAAELADYYDRSYAVPLERYAAAGERNAGRISELERWCPRRGRLLEVGASYGHSLALARERGWHVTGVELSPAAAAYARDHFGLEVYECDLAEAPLSDDSFDAAIMWHVLEHARNPKEQLLRLAVLLKPGGVVGIRVPNIASFGARVAGQWWPWMCPPAHLWFFSRKTLPTLLQACGFEVLDVKTMRGDGNNFYQYALIWAGSSLNELRLRLRPRSHPSTARGTTASTSKLSPNPPDNPPAPSGLLKTWLSVLEHAQPITNALARNTGLLIEPLERRGWGDELLVYARRPA